MKNHRHFSLFAFGMLLTFQVQAAEISLADSALYVENKNPIILHALERQKDGQDLLVPKLTLPPESTLAIEIPELARQLELQLTSPEQVNYRYVENSSGRRVSRSKEGFVCGIEIMDIPDEELRTDENMQGHRFCLSNQFWAQIQSVEGDSSSAKHALRQYLEKKSLGDLVLLARNVESDISARANQIMDIAAPVVGSPIRNCGKGCLRVTSNFGMRNHPVLKRRRQHKGVDLRAKIGTPVVAALPGKILANRTERKGSRVTGYGHYVIVSHPSAGMQTLYAHLSKFQKKAGQAVDQGDLIASSGNSGIGTAPHLHFETHKRTGKGFAPQNPINYIKRLVDMGFERLKGLGLFWA